MILDDFCHYCLSLPSVEATTPFGPEVIVYKVGGKMFALASPEDLPHRVNLKCDPERSEALREQYEAIQPGYHMNKKHWNTLSLAGLKSSLVTELVRPRRGLSHEKGTGSAAASVERPCPPESVASGRCDFANGERLPALYHPPPSQTQQGPTAKQKERAWLRHDGNGRRRSRIDLR
jgi:predicted DNA-binding protein (MmcQ/YjbR family)